MRSDWLVSFRLRPARVAAALFAFLLLAAAGVYATNYSLWQPCRLYVLGTCLNGRGREQDFCQLGWLQPRG
jgi:hypothetical protein